MTSIPNLTLHPVQCPDPGYSDHSPVLCTVTPPFPLPQGSPFWRLNNHLLENPPPTLDPLLDRFLLLDIPSLVSAWDSLKADLQSIFIAEGHRRAKLRREREVELMMIIGALTSADPIHPDSHSSTSPA
jgi:hypothetical protein